MRNLINLKLVLPSMQSFAKSSSLKSYGPHWDSLGVVHKTRGPPMCPKTLWDFTQCKVIYEVWYFSRATEKFLLLVTFCLTSAYTPAWRWGLMGWVAKGVIRRLVAVSGGMKNHPTDASRKSTEASPAREDKDGYNEKHEQNIKLRHFCVTLLSSHFFPLFLTRTEKSRYTVSLALWFESLSEIKS